jgi:hypothetical protein
MCSRVRGKFVALLRCVAPARKFFYAICRSRAEFPLNALISAAKYDRLFSSNAQLATLNVFTQRLDRLPQ